MVFTFVACSQSESPTEELADGETTKSTDAAPKDSQTLTVWCWDPTFNIYAMQEAEKIYQKDHPDFKLDIVEVSNSDIETQLTTLVASGSLDQLPDIFLNQNSSFQRQVINFPELFADLTGSKIDFSKFAQSYVALSTVDDKNYGVPFDNSASIFGYRTDLLEEAGLTVDDFTDITWTEYIDLAKKVKDATGKNILSDRPNEPDTIMQMLQSAGISLFDDEGKPSIANNDKLKAVLDQYMELRKANVITDVPGWDEYIASFVNGDVAGVMTGCWIIGSIQSAEDQSGKWAITNIPKMEIEGGTNYASNGGSSWAVSSSANKELAIDFLAATFGGSTELYDTILPSSGAIALYQPASESSVYEEGVDFFGGEKIYAQISEFAGKIPSTSTGVYYYNARDALSVAVQDLISGVDTDTALKTAEESVTFAMES
jgi:lactose/L-arabinose transport system substrate-binding protein